MKTKETKGKVKRKTGERVKGIAQEITTRILTAVLAVFIAVVAVVVVMVSSISLDAKQQELTLESRAVSYQIEDFFTKYLTIVEQMGWNANLQKLMENTTAGESLVNEEGYEIVLEEMTKIVATDTENILTGFYGDIDSNSLFSCDGYVSDETFVVADREWYRAVDEKKAILTEPYVDANSGQLVLTVAAPVYDTSGINIIGVAGLDITLTNMSELVSQYTIGKEGYVILLSNSGTFIYHPDTELQMKRLEEIDISEEVGAALINGEEKFLSYKAFGEKKYGYIGRIGEQQFYALSSLPFGEYYSTLALAILIMIILLVVGIIGVIVAIKYVAKGITKPIISLNGVAQQLADGNLDVEIAVEVQNEIGELSGSIEKTVERLKVYIDYINEISEVLNQLADGKLRVNLQHEYTGEFARVREALLHISESMQMIMDNIINSSIQVSAGADELSKTAQNLAEGASSQAAFIEELVATANVVTEQVNENSEDAKQSAAETQKVTEMMENSKQQMNQMMAAMDTISETSHQVVGIIKTIEEIADQTNLLALNASIEAARAGEHGKGFAVVASEIGSLAEQSSKAANTTKNLIGVSIGEIENGTSLAKDVVESLQTVLKAIENVNAMIEKTADNAIVQAESMDQIRDGIEEMAKGVEDNSASAEESSATSQELAAQAATLTDLVQKFELD